MHKTELFDEHILAEVRPFVSNMPEQQYVAQTGGSARMRVAKFENGRYRMRGVPGHTHNSTAICSIQADFTKRRLAELTISGNLSYALEPEVLAVGEYTESDVRPWDTEVAMYDRAIEKGIGRIRLVPENCHQEIEEPTRAIAEIRTIVSSKQQLDSLTYVDEMGIYVDPVTGLDATSQFVAQSRVYILGMRGAPPAGRQPHTARFADSRIVFQTSNGTLAGVLALQEGFGRFAGTTDIWDGTRLFEYDSQKHTYRAEAISVVLSVRQVILTADSNTEALNSGDNIGDQDTLGAVTPVRVDFDAFETEKVADRNALLRHKGFGGDVLGTTKYYPVQLSAPVTTSSHNFAVSAGAAAEIIEPLFPCTVFLADGTEVVSVTNGAATAAVGRAFLHGMPIARIPVGRAHPIYSVARKQATPAAGVGVADRNFGDGSDGMKLDSVSDRSYYLHGHQKGFEYLDDLATTFDHVFAANGALTVTVDGNAHEYNAGGVENTTLTNASARGFVYTVEDTNLDPPEYGPFAVRMQDSWLCNDVSDIAAVAGGSLYGRQQTARATAPQAGHAFDPDHAAYTNEHRRFSVSDQGRTAIFHAEPDQGPALVDMFYQLTEDKEPQYMISYSTTNEDPSANYRLLSGQFRASQDNILTNPVNYSLIQQIENIGDTYDTAAGAEIVAYAEFLEAMVETDELYNQARSNALKRRPVSKPVTAMVPLTLNFVHDRIMVRRLAAFTAYTFVAGGAATVSRGRPCLPSGATMIAHDILYNAAVTAFTQAAQDAFDVLHDALLAAGGAIDDGSLEDIALQADPSFALSVTWSAEFAKRKILYAHREMGLELSDRLVAQGLQPLADFARFHFRTRIATPQAPIVVDGVNVPQPDVITYEVARNAAGNQQVSPTEHAIRFNLGAEGDTFPGTRRYDPSVLDVGYCEELYDTTHVRNQHIVHELHHNRADPLVDLIANPPTGYAAVLHSLAFFAMADVVSMGPNPADDTFYQVTSEVDINPYYTRLFSISNAATRAEYGTSNGSVRVNTINKIEGPTRGNEPLDVYGYQHDAAGNAAIAAAQLACSSGLGDQVRVPFANIGLVEGNTIGIRGFAFATSDNVPRYAYIFFSDVQNTQGAAPAYKHPTILRFDMNNSTLEMQQPNVGGNAALNLASPYEMHTLVRPDLYNVATKQFKLMSAADAIALFVTAATRISTNLPGALPNGGNAITHVLIQFDSHDFAQDFAADMFGLRDAQNQGQGFVFRSRKRVSQPMCAPVLNPNVRIQSGPPLNFDSRHLPPEMRDFDLLLRDVDFSFLPKPDNSAWELSNLRSFEFAGGNQVATAHNSLLYLPEFKLYTINTADKIAFDEIIYTSTGMPSYIALYSRHDDNATALDYSITQPRIETLNIACDTTKRKSNVITDNMGKHHLFHLTMRNVHPASSYNSTAYNKRQVVLLAAEDIGLMQLKTTDYQSLRRVRFQFSGTCNQPGIVHIVFVYNNRGLEINGADIKVVRV